MSKFPKLALLIFGLLHASIADPKCFLRNDTVSCEDLPEIPPAFLVSVARQEVTRLDLSNNYMATLSKSGLTNFTNLQELVLRNCSVQEIEEGAFDDLLQLDSLDLADNYLKELNSKLLAPCSGLVQVNLANNLIESLDDFDTAHVPNLKTLNVSNNRLTYLPERLMEHLFLANNFTMEVTNNPWDCSESKWSMYLEAQNLTDILCTVQYTTVFRLEPLPPVRFGNQPDGVQTADMRILLWIMLSVVGGIVVGNLDRIYKVLVTRSYKVKRRTESTGKREETLSLKVTP